MKRLSEAEKLLCVMQHRASTLRCQLRQQRDAFARVDSELACVRGKIDRLMTQLAHDLFRRCRDRSALMRARGKQAVVRFDIACRKVEEAGLMERRDQIERELNASRTAVLMLEQRQDRRRDWLARHRVEYDMLRESMAEEELMERKVHADQRYQ